MKNFWTKLKKPILALAPMAGVSDSAFRQMCKHYGADVVYTEMVSADGLFYDSKKTLEFLKFKKTEQPVVIQLFGKHPEKFTKAAKICEEYGFDGIDINFGCPAKKVVAHGGGVTLMRNLPLCREIIEATMARTKLPVSVKIRSSINVETPRRGVSTPKGKITALDFIDHMKDLPLAAVMIHARPYEQPFDGEIDYEMIKAVKEKFSQSALGGGGIVLGNGGIKTPQDAKIMLEKTGLDGVGLARGLYGRPWLFEQIKYYLQTGKFKEFGQKDIIKAILLHAKFALAEKGDHGLIELRKHLLWYVSGWPNAKQLRSQLVQVKDIKDIKKIFKNSRV